MKPNKLEITKRPSKVKINQILSELYNLGLRYDPYTDIWFMDDEQISISPLPCALRGYSFWFQNRVLEICTSPEMTLSAFIACHEIRRRKWGKILIPCNVIFTMWEYEIKPVFQTHSMGIGSPHDRLKKIICHETGCEIKKYQRYSYFVGLNVKDFKEK